LKELLGKPASAPSAILQEPQVFALSYYTVPVDGFWWAASSDVGTTVITVTSL